VCPALLSLLGILSFAHLEAKIPGMERHVSHSALVRVLSGQAAAPEVEATAGHLPGCRLCWQRAGRVAAELKHEGRLAPAGEAGAVLLLLEAEERQALRRLLARGRWAELRRLSADEQLERIREDPSLRTLDMLAVLLEAASTTSLEDPYLGEETARVAYAMAGALPADTHPEPLRHDLQAEALGVVGNCRRLAADWRGAATALDAAGRHLQKGTGEPVRTARLLSLRASLASDTGHLEEALDLLAHASALYCALEDPAEVASVLVKEANALMAACRYEEAILRGEEVLSLLMPSETHLEMLVRNVLTESLVFLGRSAEALQCFTATQPLYKERRGRRTELQAGYLEALLLDSLGHFRESEKAFRENIASRMEEEFYKDAFLTLLTYFERLVQRGALDKAAGVCKEALERIEQAGVGCHAQVAELWQGLLALVGSQRLTEYEVIAARQYLARHWNAPARHLPLECSRRASEAYQRTALVPAAAVDWAPLEIRNSKPAWEAEAAVIDIAKIGYEEALELFDRELIAAGLAQCGGRLREAARVLGISRNTLRAKVRRLRLVAGERGSTEAEPAFQEGNKQARAVSRLRARAWWAELKTLPHGRRRERIESVAALRTPEMVETILEEAEADTLSDPRRGDETARLACELAGLLPRNLCAEAARNDFQCAALLTVANSRRLAGDWPGATGALCSARGHLRLGSGDLVREARLNSLEASLAADMGHLNSALELLTRAAVLYRKVQRRSAVASVMIKEANTLMSAGGHEDAIARAEETLRLIAPGEAGLRMLARNIVTESLVFLDRPTEALRSFQSTQPLFEQLRGLRTTLQVGYLEALLLDALGHEREAEAAFRDNVERRMEAEHYKDAFLTLLTWFQLHVQRENLPGAARVCREALGHLEEAGLPGHAPMKELWRHLLVLVEARRLTEGHLREARQAVVRCASPHAAEPARAALPAWAGGTAAPETEPLPAPASPAETTEPAEPKPPRPGTATLIEPPDPAASLRELGYRQALERYERQVLAAALAQSRGDLDEAARLLGLSQGQLRAKLKRMG
jgi:DNA-binding protein Fis